MRWGIVLRATDADAARAMAAARGHRVLDVCEGQRRAEIPKPGVPGACIRCGYTLLQIPVGAAGEVMCPECGVVNLPTTPLEELHDPVIRRSRRTSLFMLAFLTVLCWSSRPRFFDLHLNQRARVVFA